MDAGTAWTRVSTPTTSHRSGRTACTHRAIPAFPELEPPSGTITCMVDAPTIAIEVCALGIEYVVGACAIAFATGRGRRMMRLLGRLRGRPGCG